MVLLSDFFMGLTPSELFLRPMMHKMGFFSGRSYWHSAFHWKLQSGFSVPHATRHVRNLDEILHILMINLGEVYAIGGDRDFLISTSKGNSPERILCLSTIFQKPFTQPVVLKSKFICPWKRCHSRSLVPRPTRNVTFFFQNKQLFIDV